MERQMIIGSLHFRHSRGPGVHARRVTSVFIFFFLIFFLPGHSFGQCPDNLGFESGTFDKWKCASGNFNFNSGKFSTTETAPLPDRHVIYKNEKPVQRDPYGRFPVNCPNGSNYSIRIGNRDINAEADGVSYTVTVPANANSYAIIYNYAVVFQNPNHTTAEQPRFSAKVFDVSANKYIDCSTFDFVASANLPGFKNADTGAGVVYKPWSPVTIKLLGYAGKTVKLEFLVTDCTLGAHFGYAYLDINDDCASAITGNIACLGMDSVVLTAPLGYKDYRWFDAGFTRQLGSKNPLQVRPLPADGTLFAVEISPFPGSGCVDTLYTKVVHSAVPFSFVMPDTLGNCPPATVDLTKDAIKSGSDPGLNYQYFTTLAQTDYLSDPDAVADTGTYFIRARNKDGCIAIKPLNIRLDKAPDLSFKDPPVVTYPVTVDLTDPALVMGNLTDVLFSYWKNEEATIAVGSPASVTVAGTYYIKATAKYGCSIVKPVTVVSLIPPPPNAFSPNGDGINDSWEIPALTAYPLCRVEVFDRSGRIVFRSIGYSKSWDGTVNGKRVPMGVYYYVIKASDKIALQSGSLMVLR